MIVRVDLTYDRLVMAHSIETDDLYRVLLICSYDVDENEWVL